MKKLAVTVVLLVFGLFTPTVFAQTAEQKEFPGCVEIIRGTERLLQCENVITLTAEQTGEKRLPEQKKRGGKARAKRLTPEQRKASPDLEVLPGSGIRDFRDSPEGPIIPSVVR